MRYLFLILLFSCRLQAQYLIPTYHDIQSEFDHMAHPILFPAQASFLYFTTQDGLHRYDGKSAELIIPQSNEEERITAVCHQNKTICVGKANGKIAYYQNGKATDWKPFDGKTQSKITHLQKDHKGRFWVATYGDGLFVQADNAWFQFTKEDGLGGNDIYDAVITLHRECIVSTDHGLYVCALEGREKKVRRLDTSEDISLILTEIQYEEKNGIIVGKSYDGKLYYLRTNVGKLTLLPLQIPSGQAISLAEEWVFVINEKDKFPLWAYHLTKGIFKKFSVKGLDNDMAVIDMASHDSGVIWLACKNNGLLSVRPGLALYDLPVDNLQSAEIAEDNLYYGGENGLYVMDKHRRVTTLSKEDNILSIYFDKNKRTVWAGTYGHGILLYDVAVKKLKRIKESDGLINNNVFSIRPQGKFVWVATLAGIQKLTADGKVEMAIQSSDGLPTDYVYTLCIAKDSTLWLGTEGKGLVCVKENKIRQVVKDVSVISIAEDALGNIWFVTLENGLGRWDGKDIHFFDKNKGLTSENIKSITADAESFVYVFHDYGLDRIHIRTGQCQYLGTLPGMNKWKWAQNAVSLYSGEDIFAGMSHQLLRFSPSLLSYKIPGLEELSVSCGIQPLSSDQHALLESGEHNFKASFAGIFFEEPGRLNFRYKMTPVESEWRYTRDPDFVYTELQPGKYEFTIEVGVGHQFYSQNSKTYTFTIKPSFVQTPWFYIGLILMITGIIYVYFYIRNRQKRRLLDLENEKVRMQLDTLKSQINPHFLFNSFNTLIGTIEEDKESAITYVEKLADFYRSMLEYRDKNLIPLSEEIALLDNYIFLLKQRYGQNIEITVEANTTENRFIIPLTLQLLVENAIKHNIVSKSQPLHIFIKQKGDRIEITNAMQPRINVEKSTHFGLHSLDKRYKELINQHIRIDSTNQIFFVSIPLAQNDQIGSH